MKTRAQTYPIAFSEPMLRALRDGRKTQDRRLIEPQPFADGCYTGDVSYAGWAPTSTADRPIARFHAAAIGSGFGTRREGIPCPWGGTGNLLWVIPEPPPLRRPLNAYRHASEITLELTDLRVERVRDCYEECLADGVPMTHRDHHWVWVLFFTVHQRNIDALLAEQWAGP